jgi:fatty acid desaturase
LYRHPAVLFGIGPAYLFILRQRLPFGLMGDGWVPWVSTMATNGAIALVVAGMMWWVGIEPFQHSGAICMDQEEGLPAAVQKSPYHPAVVPSTSSAKGYFYEYRYREILQ